MRRAFIILMLAGAVILAAIFLYTTYSPEAKNKYAAFEAKELEMDHTLRAGDLIFQHSLSAQSLALQQATGSEVSHCGILFQSRGYWFVFEAVQPVQSTSLAEWLARGKDGKCVILRLRQAKKVLTPATVSRMQEVAYSFLDKDYDTTFGWSDDRLYSSELIWKIYQRATGLELGKVQKRRDVNLNTPAGAIPPDEPVILPAAILNSPLLVRVYGNGDR